jgi:alkanesulfonate monooxygenase SsuD/methylene tetrahydromethanopterin reductase-like flavin-dependent oxidoreductase (luciferase family)
LAGAHGPARTVAYAQAAERAGFGGVWLAEHHFISYGQTPSATVLAAHVLGCTSRIAVGTAACVLPARHPVSLGEEAALIDAVAPGRFRLGVARGGPWVELEVFGTGMTRREHAFAESLDLLRRWVSGTHTVGANGDHFTFRQVAVVPRPRSPVPIWIAATSAPTVDLAAARGLPLLLGVHDDDQTKARTLARYRRTATAHGHHADHIPHASVHLAYLGEPDRLRQRLVSWLSRTSEYVRLDGNAPAREPESYADHLLRLHPPDPPDQLAHRLADAARNLPGIRHLLLMVEAAADETEQQIIALGEHLHPALLEYVHSARV